MSIDTHLASELMIRFINKNWMKVLPKKFYATIEYYKRKNKKRKKAALLACAA